VLDTLGKLYAHGHGIGGCCLACQRVFAVSLPALIKERRGDCRYIGMRPLSCPGCRGRRTTFQVTAPARGGVNDRIPPGGFCYGDIITKATIAPPMPKPW
jgi:hypothetical protein